MKCFVVSFAQVIIEVIDSKQTVKHGMCAFLVVLVVHFSFEMAKIYGALEMNFVLFAL